MTCSFIFLVMSMHRIQMRNEFILHQFIQAGNGNARFSKLPGPMNPSGYGTDTRGIGYSSAANLLCSLGDKSVNMESKLLLFPMGSPPSKLRTHCNDEQHSRLPLSSPSAIYQCTSGLFSPQQHSTPAAPHPPAP
ncbi:hypothetical protein SAY87_003903 [Trapa incisa]|uniref:Uncharacterized protein n=1 Tax=Trapa incisa TaxID=236973 RepID=A0AAN7PKT1_9MYRT|nr:hypothetical protein SAY87_003903 [Trapa incisa]